MSWLVLMLACVAEAVWPVALGKSQGFTQWVPSVVFVVALAASMGGLAWAMRTLPTGTAYAVWVGIGASLAIAYGKHDLAEVLRAMLGEPPNFVTGKLRLRPEYDYSPYDFDSDDLDPNEAY